MFNTNELLLNDNEPLFNDNRPLFINNESLFYNNKPLFSKNESLFYNNKSLFNGNKLLFNANGLLFNDNESSVNDNEPLFNNNESLFINNTLFLMNIFVEKYIRITTIYEDFSGQGRSLTMVPFKRSYAWLKIWGMKNKTSSFFPASLIRGVDVAYDNAFFSGVMFRFISRINLPSSPINFNGVSAPFNDRAESWLSLGI